MEGFESTADLLQQLYFQKSPNSSGNSSGQSGQLQGPWQDEKQAWKCDCLGLPCSCRSSQQHRQDRWLEFVWTVWGYVDKAEWGRSDPVLDLCGLECRGRGICARLYRLCGKQGLNWATAWSTAAHCSLFYSHHVSCMDIVDWEAHFELHTNNAVWATAPCHFNGMVLL